MIQKHPKPGLQLGLGFRVRAYLLCVGLLDGDARFQPDGNIHPESVTMTEVTFLSLVGWLGVAFCKELATLPLKLRINSE